MSVVTNGANICPALLLTLMDVIGENASPTRGLSAGALLALHDPDNVRQGPEVRSIAESGHIRTARVAFKRPSIISQTSSSDSGGCFEGDPNPYVEDTIEIDGYREITGSVEIETVRTFCREYSNLENLGLRLSDNKSVQATFENGLAQTSLSVIREIGQSILFDRRAVLEGIDKDVVDYLAANYAKWADGSNNKTFTVMGSDGAPNKDQISRMLQQLGNLGMMGTPIHVGSDTGALDRFLAWERQFAAYCCQDGGIDFGGITSKMGKWYRSRQITSEVDDDAVFTFFPGLVKYIPFLKNVGNFGVKIGNTWLATLPVPEVPGLTLDFDIREDECERSYIYRHSQNFTVWAGEGYFKTNDALEGVNGLVLSSAVQS
jgi:hypothetical protein